MKNVSFLVAFCLVFVLRLRQQSKCMYFLFFVCLGFFKGKIDSEKMFIFSSLLSSRQPFECKRAHASDIINMRHRALFDF